MELTDKEKFETAMQVQVDKLAIQTREEEPTYERKPVKINQENKAMVAGISKAIMEIETLLTEIKKDIVDLVTEED